GHAAGADDDERLAQEAQLFALLDRARVTQRIEPKRITLRQHELADLVVIRLRMESKDRRYVDRQRAVDEYGQGRDVALDHQLVQRIYQLLRAPEGEGRDDQGAAALVRVVDDFLQLALRHHVRFVRAVA